MVGSVRCYAGGFVVDVSRVDWVVVVVEFEVVAGSEVVVEFEVLAGSEVVVGLNFCSF